EVNRVRLVYRVIATTGVIRRNVRQHVVKNHIILNPESTTDDRLPIAEKTGSTGTVCETETRGPIVLVGSDRTRYPDRLHRRVGRTQESQWHSPVLVAQTQIQGQIPEGSVIVLKEVRMIPFGRDETCSDERLNQTACLIVNEVCKA